MKETLQEVEKVIVNSKQLHYTVDGKLEKYISQRINVSNFSTFTKDNE